MTMPRTLPLQLARSSPEDLLDAQRRCRDVLEAARDLADACGHDPDLAVCSEAGCGLPALGDDGRRCAVAHRLASMAQRPAGGLSVEVAAARFTAALGASVPAIRTCRQTAHPSGRCWFTPLPHTDGCGQLLQLAHELG